MASNDLNSRDSINHAIQQFHYCAQFLARLTHAYLRKTEDDSHNNMLWEGEGLKTRIINGNSDFYGFLNYHDFSIAFHRPDETVISTVSLENTWGKIEDDLRNAIGQLGLDPLKFKPISHYEIPHFPPGPAFEMIKPNAGVISELIQLRSQAQELLESIKEKIAKDLEVRVWPHHFDTGLFGLLANGRNGMGMGWAIADSIHDQPYFYTSPYTPGRTIQYNHELEWKGIGLFGPQAFVGTTLPLKSYRSLPLKEQKSTIFSFLNYSWEFLISRMESK